MVVSKKLNYLISVIFVILFFAGLYSAEFYPVMNFRCFAGQYFFEKEASSFGGNLNFNIIPAIKFSDKFSLLPALYSDYRGVKDVTELVGGGTLYQQSWSNTLSIKPIFNISETQKLRAKIGYALQLYRETTDEEWTKGLFDYKKLTTGIEYEAEAIDSKVFLGYDIFSLNFYNYKSLAETKYGQELSGKVGENVLDFVANEIYSQGKKVLGERLIIDYFINYTIENFVDQKLVTETGEYSPAKRVDNILYIKFSPNYVNIPTGPLNLITGLNLGGCLYNSNQNNYDVNNKKFNSNYYDYQEINFGPNMVCKLNKVPLTLSLSYDFSYRKYMERLVQDNVGNYTNDKINITKHYIVLGVIYPVGENLQLVFQPSVLNSSSNMKYETVYKYNYTSTNYFFGLIWEH